MDIRRKCKRTRLPAASGSFTIPFLKKEEVEVRVVEHLYRAVEWEVKAKSMDFARADARTIEFRPKVRPDGEAIITYTVRYSW